MNKRHPVTDALFNITIITMIGSFIAFLIAGCSPGYYDLYEENDYFTLVNTDSQYTQGLQFRYTDNKNNAYMVGQQIYTPADKQETELTENDRPYGGWLYVGKETRDIHSMTSQSTYTWQVGVVGPASLAEQAQNETHRLVNIATVKGWDNQLNNEPGILYRAERQDITLQNRALGLELDNLSNFGVNLGNVKTDLFVGNIIRWGENLPSSFGYRRLPGNADETIFRPEYNFYAFLGAEGKLVGHNIFLDGNSWEASHEVEKEYLVGNLRVGLSFRVYSIRVTYTFVVTTPEFRERHSNHGYGSLNFSYERL